MGATECKCALLMFIADHTTKLFYNGKALAMLGIKEYNVQITTK